MKRRKFVKLGGTTIAGSTFGNLIGNRGWTSSILVTGNDAESLYNAFKTPDDRAKPFVRWWWNGLRIIKPEIERELEQLKNLGIGGVEINALRLPETADPMHYKEIEWLSSEWMELIQFTLKEAKKRNIICDIIVGAGWPFGGEFVEREDQTVLMALGTKNIKGPQTFEISKKELEESVNPPIGFKYHSPTKELRSLRLVPARLQNLKQVENFDEEVQKDSFTIRVPEGDHVLYYLVKITGFMAVIHGVKGADGPIINHYKKSSVRGYLNRMSDAFKNIPGGLGENFRSIFVDSLELEGANWNDDFFEEFEKRRHYSLETFLPFILFKTGKMGKALDEKYGADFDESLLQTLSRVRYDFEITKMEIFQERFLQTFTDWCISNKVKSRVQAYGQEIHPLDASMQIDIPECETWIGASIGEEPLEFDFRNGRGYCMVNKFVSSAARLSGKKLVSCEEITNTSLVFNASLERIKVTGDQSNLSGVTHSILHGFNYSPPDAPFPGWIRYGTYFNERNPLWPYFSKWIEYKSRLSAVFQRCTLMSDVAVFHPLADLWSKYGLQRDPWPDHAYPSYVHNIWEAIHQCGNGCDYISDQIIQDADFSNGNIKYNDRIYSTLLVIEAERMLPETAAALKKYAISGGRLIFIGRTPDKIPGFYNHELLDKEVEKIINETNSQKNVASFPRPEKEKGLISWFQRIQQQFNIPKYIEFSKSTTSVSQVYYQYKEIDIFFISNSNTSSSAAFIATFNVRPGRIAWLWDPETGKRSIYKTEGPFNKLNIRLGPAQSVMIVFDKRKNATEFNPSPKENPIKKKVSDLWKLDLQYVNGERKTIDNFELRDFKGDPILEKFGGTAIYETSFEINSEAGYNFLNLGVVKGVSEVLLNGKNLGVRWYGEHIFPIDGAIKNGRNTLQIKLSTPLGNFMHSIPENKDTIKWIKGRKQPLYPMGVMGPVLLST